MAKLREQVASAKKQVTAKTVAKLLVDKGHLTAFQAKRLVEEDQQIVELAEVTEDFSSDVSGLTPLGDDDDLTGMEAVNGLTPLDAGTADGLTPIDDGLTPIGSPENRVESLNGADSLGGVDYYDRADSLGGADSLDGADALGGAGNDKPNEKSGLTPKKQKKPKKHTFDTPLMLAGGASLILLIGAVIGLYGWLNSADAVKMFEAGQEAYEQQSYSDAIEKYKAFLKRFPEDSNASLARVRSQLARLRQNVEASNWERSLKTAESILPKIEPEESFELARPELAGTLPKIAKGFATEAKSSADTTQAQTLVDLAVGAMKLVDNPSYIPSTLRKTIQATIDAIKEDISIAERNINREKTLRTALENINGAIAQGDTPGAYALRKQLLKTYPSLESDAGLIAAVRTITEREKDAVKIEDLPLEPLTEEPPYASEFRVVMAANRGKPAPGVSNRTVYYLVRGAVYAFDATTGAVKWRRFVGYETVIPPRPVSQESDADVLLVDGRNNELVRVAGGSGKTIWRLPIGGPFAAPVLDGERILIATPTGALLSADAQSGASAQRTVFPQPLPVGPLHPAQSTSVYQIGEHSNLYRLNAGTLACEEVFYLGHRAGGISVAPVAVRGKMFVVENAGVDFCLLHIITLDDSENGLQFAQKPIRLKGNAVLPPLVYQKRVLVTTDLGGVHYFEIDPANEEKPVSEIAKRIAAGKSAEVGYRVVDLGQLWLTDNRLSKYELQQTTGEIARKWVKDEGGGYNAPLQLIGDVLFHARRQKDSGGVVITAANRDNGSAFWRTELGVPLVGVLERKGGKIAAISARGDLFSLDGEIVRAGYNGKPQSPTLSGPMASSFGRELTLPDGKLLFAGDSIRERVLSYDPNATAARPKVVALQLPENSSVSGELNVFENGVLAPINNGQLHLLSPTNGKALVLPLQPPSEPGDEMTWSRPVVLGKEFVVARSDRKLFRVGVEPKPQPHLTALATQSLDLDVISSLANVGNTIYGVGRSGSGEAVVVIQFPGLEYKRAPLKGRVLWGPETQGGRVFLATEQDGLLCFDGGEKPLWTAPLQYGAPVGNPLAVDGNFLFASQAGMVWLVDGASGKELKKFDVGEPLGAGVTPFGPKLLAPGSDGVLHILPGLAP